MTTFRRTALLLLLIGGCAIGHPESMPSLRRQAPGDSTKEVKAKSPRGAMLRSIFIPGWGQFYNGKWFKGLIIAGAEVGLIANAVIQNQYAVQSKTELERAFYVDNRNLSFWWLAGVILYSALDAYVDAHLSTFDESPDLSFAAYPCGDDPSSHTTRGWFLSIRWNF